MPRRNWRDHMERLTDGSHRALAAVVAQSRATPFAANLSLVSIPIGLVALLLGPSVSSAFTLVYHRPELIYVWGIVLLLGGANVAHGIIARVPSRERGGLYVLAVAWGFYGVSVLIGLRTGGLVAGPLALTLALSALQRARIIVVAVALLAASGSVPDERTSDHTDP
jgi:hypothetical protein